MGGDTYRTLENLGGSLQMINHTTSVSALNVKLLLHFIKSIPNSHRVDLNSVYLDELNVHYCRNQMDPS